MQLARNKKIISAKVATMFSMAGWPTIGFQCFTKFEVFQKEEIVKIVHSNIESDYKITQNL
jgi:hypothetical protein